MVVKLEHYLALFAIAIWVAFDWETLIVALFFAGALLAIAIGVLVLCISFLPEEPNRRGRR